MDGKVARAGARFGVDDGRIAGRQHAARRVEPELHDVVGPQDRHIGMPVSGIDEDAVRLRLRVDDLRRFLADGRTGVDRVAGDLGADLGGTQQVLPGSVDSEVGHLVDKRRRADQGEFSVAVIDREGRDRIGLAAQRA
jgi:hypothetical protein